MRAVNLIPVEQRGGMRRSGSALGSYVLLLILALVVVAGGAYALANRTVSDRRQELPTSRSAPQAAAAEAQGLQAYTSFTALRQERSETVRSLAVSRFNWSQALHEVARTIPADAWLTSMRATVTPSSSADGGASDPLRSALATPAIEILGCTTSQTKVANVISSLRRIDGVERVSLSSSVKIIDAGAKSTGDSAGGGGGGGDCRNGNTRFPQFSMTLFFKAPSAPTGAQSKSGATP
jgi:Tfp pilus assembly protein PilN